MILKTDAVVLHARRYRESSKIVILYTREHGRVSAVARGVLQPKNKGGSVLQPMAYISAVIYRKEGRELQNLATVETLERYAVLTSSLERMSAAMAIVEIVNAAVHDEDRNDPLFDLIVSALRRLDDPAASETSIHLWFLVQLSSILGYAINVETCGVCSEEFTRDRDPVPFNLAVAAPLCREHETSMAARPVRRATFEMLRTLIDADAEAAAMLRPALNDATELLDVLTSFIRYHVEGLRKLRVRGVSSKVLDQGVIVEP